VEEPLGYKLPPRPPPRCRLPDHPRPGISALLTISLSPQQCHQSSIGGKNLRRGILELARRFHKRAQLFDPSLWDPLDMFLAAHHEG